MSSNPTPKPDPLNPLGDLWDARARVYGKRCVLDLAIPEEHYDYMTDFQWRYMRPLLQKEIMSEQRLIALDYGCGSGRFVPLIRSLLPNDSIVFGYDPCKALIENTSMHYTDGLFYMSGSPSKLLNLDEPFDLIFIALVLGGLPKAVLPDIANLLKTILREKGFIFFAEHTDPSNPGNDFWHFHPEEFYIDLFKPLIVRKVGEYPTRGNWVSLFVARSE